MGLNEAIHQDPVSSLQTRSVTLVDFDETVRDAVSKMRYKRIGVVIVVDAGGKPVGMFNEKILIRILAERPAAMDEPVGEHLTSHIVTIRHGDSISKLIAIMQEFKVRWVCVVDDAGKPVAITGMLGVMRYFAEWFPHVVNAQSFESKLSIKQREGA